MIPRTSYAGINSTTLSAEFSDPAILAMQNVGDDIRNTETSDAALARIVAALADLLPAWHRDPARGCAGMEPATFISKQPKARAAAFTACGRCPTEIRQACLDWAVTVDDRRAIAGGMDPPARARLVRQRRADQEDTTPEPKEPTDATS